MNIKVNFEIKDNEITFYEAPRVSHPDLVPVITINESEKPKGFINRFPLYPGMKYRVESGINEIKIKFEKL